MSEEFVLENAGMLVPEVVNVFVGQHEFDGDTWYVATLQFVVSLEDGVFFFIPTFIRNKDKIQTIKDVSKLVFRTHGVLGKYAQVFSKSFDNIVEEVNLDHLFPSRESFYEVEQDDMGGATPFEEEVKKSKIFLH